MRRGFISDSRATAAFPKPVRGGSASTKYENSLEGFARGVEMFQRQRVAYSLLPRTRVRVTRTFMVRASREATMTYPNRNDGEQPDDSKQRHHDAVWNGSVET